MKKVRLIARIDVKNEYVIKGIHLEGLRKVGNPNDLAKKYYEAGIDEIVFMDVVASLYDRNNLFPVIEKACQEVFVPISVGGGIRSIQDIEQALKSGADKIAINTGAVRDPGFIREASRIYGSQCIISSVEAKRRGDSWEVYINNGREETGIDVFDWIKKMEDMGAGELLLTSVDREGTKKGFDLELIKRVMSTVSIPVIASGGAGNPGHLCDLWEHTRIDAVAIASILHYNMHTVQDIKKEVYTHLIPVRL